MMVGCGQILGIEKTWRLDKVSSKGKAGKGTIGISERITENAKEKLVEL
jgi:hypothetical protein